MCIPVSEPEWESRCPISLRAGCWQQELTETWPRSDSWQVCRKSVTELALVPVFWRCDGSVVTVHSARGQRTKPTPLFAFHLWPRFWGQNYKNSTLITCDIICHFSRNCLSILFGNKTTSFALGFLQTQCYFFPRFECKNWYSVKKGRRKEEALAGKYNPPGGHAGSLQCAFTKGINGTAEDHRGPLKKRHGARVKARWQAEQTSPAERQTEQARGGR